MCVAGFLNMVGSQVWVDITLNLLVSRKGTERLSVSDQVNQPSLCLANNILWKGENFVFLNLTRGTKNNQQMQYPFKLDTIAHTCS